MTVPIFDCTTYLHVALVAEAHEAAWQSLKSDPLLAACVQAEATRHAGKLAARATTYAYLFTLLAGTLAFAGGAMAIYPSLAEQAKIRSSQSLHTLDALQNYHSSISTSKYVLKNISELFSQRPNVSLNADPLPPILSDLEWLASSTLSIKSQESLRKAHYGAMTLNKFIFTLSHLNSLQAQPFDPADPVRATVPSEAVPIALKKYDEVIALLQVCFAHLEQDVTRGPLQKFSNLMTYLRLATQRHAPSESPP